MATEAEVLEARLDAHEQICAERYLAIHEKIGDIKKVVGWFAATILLIVVGVLGWSLQQQWSATQATQQAMQAQIQLLMAKSADSSS